MASANAYAKNYSNRRSTVEVESYKLMLFPADNSIAVVKSKQCSPAEHDGFLHVQSGRKKFTGVVLEEGKNNSSVRNDTRKSRNSKTTISIHYLLEFFLKQF
jgi:hypothetical protein